MSRVFLPIAITGIAAVAVALRSWRLGERALWFDEAFTWRLASFPWAEIIERTARDNNPPLYYLLLKAWMGCFGDSTVAMRLPSVVAGALSCVAVYLLVCEAYRRAPAIERGRGQWMGLFAAALVAVTALQVRWGWEARMYACGAALSAFSSWLLLRALHAPLAEARPKTTRRPAPLVADPAPSAVAADGAPDLGDMPGTAVASNVAWRPWVLYAGVALAFAYVHTYALFSLAAQGIFAAGYLLAESRWRPTTVFMSRRFRLALVSFVIIGAGWLPWLPVVLRQNAQVEQAYWTAPLTRWSVPTLCHQIFADPENRGANRRAAAVAAAACALVVLALLWRPREGDWFLLVSSVVPLSMAVTASASGRNILSVGCFIFSQLFLLAAAARLVSRIRKWPERTIVAAVLLMGLLLLHVDYVERLRVTSDSGIRAAAARIAAARRPSEPVVVCSHWYYLPMRYHLGRDAGCWLLGSAGALAHYEGTAALTEADFIGAEELGELTAQRVWVVGSLGNRPAGWRQVSQAAFYEGYGVPGAVVVVEYTTGAATPVHDP
ncbi:MAG TPA: glycosyltransferase family 39 protein [Pirellulales bacterium]|nr:glycosyltransferase family 39 protein [Pirellulales bacterium]